MAGNAARCAVELAVLDAYGRSFGQPLSALTGILAPDLFDSRPRVRYSGAITSARNFKLLLAVTAMRLYGFHQMKVKVGIEGYHDAERLRRIRRVLGPAVDIRIDANEAWNPDEVIAKVRELELYGISSVEQPVPHGRVNRLTGIRKELNIPFMLDESLCGMVDAERAVAEETCDLFNIRLSKCGGFIPSLRLAQFARQRGLGYQLGCQVGESEGQAVHRQRRARWEAR